MKSDLGNLVTSDSNYIYTVVSRQRKWNDPKNIMVKKYSRSGKLLWYRVLSGSPVDLAVDQKKGRLYLLCRGMKLMILKTKNGITITGKNLEGMTHKGGYREINHGVKGNIYHDGQIAVTPQGDLLVIARNPEKDIDLIPANKFKYYPKGVKAAISKPGDLLIKLNASGKELWRKVISLKK